MGKALRGQGVQFAALPTARIDGEIRVLLITSRESRRWVLPKGWAEAALTGAALAAKEAFEEAGVVGTVTEAPLGCYHYDKRLAGGATRNCTVAVHAMAVERLLADWPERTERERVWFTPAEAALRVEEAELAGILQGLAQA